MRGTNSTQTAAPSWVMASRIDSQVGRRSKCSPLRRSSCPSLASRVFNSIPFGSYTYWIEESESNRRRGELALIVMDAECGKGDSEWDLVRDNAVGWLSQQSVYYFLTKFGPLDVFRSVKGVDSFQQARERAIEKVIDGQLKVPLLSAKDLLECQLVLPEESRRLDRVAYLKRFLEL